MESALLTSKEAAKYLGIAPGTLHCWTHKNRYYLPVVKMGSLSKYRVSDLEDFINRQTRIDPNESTD